jgi:hypothetical protein
MKIAKLGGVLLLFSALADRRPLKEKRNGIAPQAFVGGFFAISPF